MHGKSGWRAGRGAPEPGPELRIGRMRLPARYRTLAWVTALFMAVNTLVRVGLAAFDGDPANLMPWRLVPVLATGALFDVAALAYLLVPFALLAAVLPDRRWGRLAHGVLATALGAAAIAAMLLVAIAEAVFWNEFSSRFNFVAVDYLVYTREVIGNVRESYPMGWILAALALATAALALALLPRLWRAALGSAGRPARRLGTAAAVLALPLASFQLVGDGARAMLGSPSSRELAGNGYYEFMRAFRTNDLDFRAFYQTVSDPRARQVLREELGLPERQPAPGQASDPLEREVVAPARSRRLNVVLVSMESLGADYVESFGGRPGLTPNLDRLAHDGLMFTQTYATGLRTVRGLEAITLSVPPTPGQAVPVREHNKGFQTLGGVLAAQGYEPLYLYGGYSYFDNMRDFFGGNGYTVIDRSAIPRDAISHETIWGVADEDLFRLAIREIDARTATGALVFAHVMTTSNHRPFTYPEGRVGIPSGSGRDGAVEYSDWAIGEFIREASLRPWFHRTIFVFIADHTSHGRGRSDLPPENYRIPFVIYAPGIVAPGRAAQVASQMDVAPTLLALLSVSYRSHFFGQDILTEGRRHPRALMANYLTVGYMQDGVIATLSPKRHTRLIDAGSGRQLSPGDPRAGRLLDEAIAYYQVATDVLRGTAQVAPTAGPTAPNLH